MEVQKGEEVEAPSWVEEAEEPLHLEVEGVVMLIAQGHQGHQGRQASGPEPEPEHRSTADT